MNISKTYTMAAIGLATAVAPLFGYSLTDSAALEQMISAVIFVLIGIDRLFKGDISAVGLKKN